MEVPLPDGLWVVSGRRRRPAPPGRHRDQDARLMPPRRSGPVPGSVQDILSVALAPPCRLPKRTPFGPGRSCHAGCPSASSRCTPAERADSRLPATRSKCDNRQAGANIRTNLAAHPGLALRSSRGFAPEAGPTLGAKHAPQQHTARRWYGADPHGPGGAGGGCRRRPAGGGQGSFPDPRATPSSARTGRRPRSGGRAPSTSKSSTTTRSSRGR